MKEMKLTITKKRKKNRLIKKPSLADQKWNLKKAKTWRQDRRDSHTEKASKHAENGRAGRPNTEKKNNFGLQGRKAKRRRAPNLNTENQETNIHVKKKKTGA